MMPAALGVVLILFASPVVLRDGTRYEAPPGRSFAVTEQGLQIDIAPDPAAGVVPVRRVVGWGDIERFEGEWGDAEPFRAISDAVARARRRLARGDVSGAQSLLEPIAGRYLGGAGPTTGSIGSMLAFCRVLRGDRAGAAEAWVAWGRSAEPAPPWIDEPTGLAPSIPPVWSPADAARAAATLTPLVSNSSDGDAASELARLYALAALHAASDGPATRLRADPGVRLVWDMVRAQVDPDPAGRRGAREALRRRARTAEPDWQAAWVHLGLGVSLLGEPDRMDADAGAAELLTVVLLHQRTAPGLADLAAGLAAEYFERTGRSDHARSVREMNAAAAAGLARTTSPRATAAGDEPRPDGESLEETP